MTDFLVLLLSLSLHINCHYNSYQSITLCSDLNPTAKYVLYSTLELPVSFFLTQNYLLWILWQCYNLLKYIYILHYWEPRCCVIQWADAFRSGTMHFSTVLLEEFYCDLNIPYCFIVHKYLLCLLHLEVDEWQFFSSWNGGWHMLFYLIYSKKA